MDGQDVEEFVENHNDNLRRPQAVLAPRLCMALGAMRKSMDKGAESWLYYGNPNNSHV
jgi:hypothetical protein